MALETVQATATTSTIEPISSTPRISFSADFPDETNSISINPHPHSHAEGKLDAENYEKAKGKGVSEFEFLSSNESNREAMLTADELFFEGKLLPFWEMQQHSEKLNKINLKTKDAAEDQEEVVNKDESSVSDRFVDDDPSPRPPNCTVLWKELLKLKKQRASSLSTSSSSTEERKEGSGNRDKHVKRIKKGLDRTRSGSIRIRPMINVPICTQMKNSALPPLFPLKKGRLER